MPSKVRCKDPGAGLGSGRPTFAVGRGYGRRTTLDRARTGFSAGGRIRTVTCAGEGHERTAFRT